VHLQLHFPALLSLQMQFHGPVIAAAVPPEYGNSLIPVSPCVIGEDRRPALRANRLTSGHVSIGYDHSRHPPIGSDHSEAGFVRFMPTELIERWLSRWSVPVLSDMRRTVGVRGKPVVVGTRRARRSMVTVGLRTTLGRSFLVADPRDRGHR
jgi:hypothetical protein